MLGLELLLSSIIFLLAVLLRQTLVPLSAMAERGRKRPHGMAEVSMAEEIGNPICHIHLDLKIYVFTARHEMQTRSSDENSVRPSVRLSVCLSVTRVYSDKTVERSVQIFIPYERTFSLVF